MKPMLLPARTPRVVRSPLVGDEDRKILHVVAIEGSQFEDGMHRLVVSEFASDETVRAVLDALIALDALAETQRWITSLLEPNRESGGA